MTASLPATEKKRLKVLWQYEVLDTVPEEVFDDLTELAARICEAPIAMITLVDENRQWFKSKVGVTISETSRDISFCSHAIGQPEEARSAVYQDVVRIAHGASTLALPMFR